MSIEVEFLILEVERLQRAVIAERQACIDICDRLSNMVIALGVTGDAARMARDIAEEIKARGG